MAHCLYHRCLGRAAFFKLLIDSVMKLNGIIYPNAYHHRKGGHGDHGEGYMQ